MYLPFCRGKPTLPAPAVPMILPVAIPFVFPTGHTASARTHQPYRKALTKAARSSLAICGGALCTASATAAGSAASLVFLLRRLSPTADGD